LAAGLAVATQASAWCASGYKEYNDPCNPTGAKICTLPGQPAPSATCDGGNSNTNQNTNNNSNKNSNTNTQGQGQSQGQGQAQSSSNTNTLTANGGNATGGNASAQGGGGGQGGAGGQGGTGMGGAGGSNSNTGNNTGNGGGAYIGGSTTTDNYNAQKIPVNTALAPTVITGSDQCLVPVSGSVQTSVVGIAVGSAKRDEICEALKLSDRLKYLGQYAASVRLLAISDDRVAQALKDVGGYVPVVNAAEVHGPLARNEFAPHEVPVTSVSVDASPANVNVNPNR
jgi:hypothetical protein